MADEGNAPSAPAGAPAGGPRKVRDLTSGPIGRTLVLFALPTLGSNVLQSLNGSINAIWVGRFLGEDALAATANGNILMFLLLAFVFGFGMATTVLIGQAFGRRDIIEARRALGTGVGFFVPCVLVVSILGWIYAPELLHLLGTPKDSLPLALTYMRVIFLGMPASLLLVLLMMALRGAGDSMSPLWFMILSVVLDSALNPVFILGLGPMPRMGIAGAATATLIANCTSLIGLVAYIYARDLPLRLKGKELALLKPDGPMLSAIIRKGVPTGLQMIVISSAALTMLGLVNRLGTVTTAAYSVTQQLWTYVQMPAMALGAAVSAMAAQNIGAGNWDRVSQITRVGVVYNILLTGSLVVLLTITDRYALQLFLGSDSPALPIARHIQLVGTWGYVFFGVSLVVFGAVRANGKALWPLIILFIAMYPARLLVAFGLEPQLGADALWLSFPVGMVVTMIGAVSYYLFGDWRKGSMLKRPVNEEECVELATTSREPGGSLNPTA